MKGIGELFKSARGGKRLSLDGLEEKTKIKKEFINAIEKEDWEKLPAYPVVMGFVKNIAEAVGVEVNKAEALLRRDYPPTKLAINPKPDVSREFHWGPKHTFIVSIITVLLTIFLYLGLQYKKFISPPGLEIKSPQEDALIKGNFVLIEGKTDVDAVVVANNQPVIVDSDGNFSFELGVSSTTEKVEILAKSRSGRETKVVRKIKVE